MNHCRIPSEDRRRYRWMPGVGETATERDLNDVLEVKLNLIGCQRIGESIERRLQPGFKIFEDVYDFLNSCLVDYTARSIDEQTTIVVKLNVWSQFHRLPGLSHKAAARARKESKEPITGRFRGLAFPGYYPCAVNLLGH